MTTPDEDATQRRDAEELLLANLHVIDAVARFVARRHHLRPDEAEEFRSLVRFKLVDDNYAVLRKYRGNSQIRTYLTTVIQRVFLDERIRAWGRWRPSIVARRCGPTAILFEQFVVRDRRSFDEACALLEGRGIFADRQALLHLYERMPTRSRPRVVDSDLAESAAAPGSAEDEVLDSERVAAAARIADALRRAVSGLAPRERLMVQLRFLHGLSIADIARAMSLDQKGLYREFERLTHVLRSSLESEGLQGSDVTELLGHSQIDFEGVLREAVAENPLRVRLNVMGPAKQQRENP